MYTCRSCKTEVNEIHLCGKIQAGRNTPERPVIVQYIQRYPSARRGGYLKTFGSMSEARKLARFQNMVEKGWLPS